MVDDVDEVGNIDKVDDADNVGEVDMADVVDMCANLGESAGSLHYQFNVWSRYAAQVKVARLI